LLAMQPRVSVSADFMVAAYLPEWRYEGANWDDICKTVTHLIFFSLEVTPKGGLAARDRMPRSKLLQAAREAADAHGTKLLICVGGNGRSAGFSSAVASAKARARFVGELLKLCQKNGLDGVDLNWEYPGYAFGSGYQPEAAVARDYRGLHLLIKELREAFGPEGLTLTLAYYPDGRQERLLAEAAPLVDAMHMMSYDQGGRHSTPEFASKVARQGAELLPPAKVTLGLPFYGRHIKTGDWKSYEDLVQAHRPLPSVDEAGGYYFNGADTISAKTREAAALGLGGVMIWEVGQDCRLNPVTHGPTTHVRTCPDGDESSLLVALRSALPAPSPAPSPVPTVESSPRDEL